MTTPNSQLIVRRTLDHDMAARPIFYRLDDLPEQAIPFGKTIELNLAPEVHRLRFTNWLFSKRIEVTLTPGETAIFQVANTYGGCLFSMFAAASGALACRLKVERL